MWNRLFHTHPQGLRVTDDYRIIQHSVRACEWWLNEGSALSPAIVIIVCFCISAMHGVLVDESDHRPSVSREKRQVAVYFLVHDRSDQLVPRRLVFPPMTSARRWFRWCSAWKSPRLRSYNGAPSTEEAGIALPKCSFWTYCGAVVGVRVPNTTRVSRVRSVTRVQAQRQRVDWWRVPSTPRKDIPWSLVMKYPSPTLYLVKEYSIRCG